MPRFPGLRKRTPVVLQAENSECGLACLAMIASHHGLEHDAGSLRAVVDSSDRGTSLSELMQMAAGLGLSPRALRLEPSALAQLRTPCILHWDLDHFVVLERMRGKTALLLDPGFGRRRLPLDQVSGHFTGVALELTPTPEFRTGRPRTRLSLGTFFGSVRNLPGALARVLLLSLSIQALALLMPFYSQIVIDELLASGDTSLLAILALSFGLVGLLTVAVSALRFILVLGLGASLQFDWGARVFHHLLRLPLSYFERRSVADVVSRFRSLNAIQNLATHTIVEAVVDGVMAISTAIVMVLYSPPLAAVTFGAVGAYVALRLGIFRTQREIANTAIVSGARESGHLLESLRAILSIKCLSGEAVRESTWQNRAAESIRTNTVSNGFNTGWQLASQALLAVEGVVILWLGAGLILAGSFSIGMLTALIAYKTLFTSRAVALVDKLIEYRLTSVHLERIADITDAHAEPRHVALHAPATSITGDIAVTDVWFRYSPRDPWVLRKLSLRIRPGECVAIAARSGTGKTTLVKLMLGLLHPDTGAVAIDGIPLGPENAGHFRRHAAAVMQDDTLLTGSIADNVAFFEARQDMARIEQACRDAEIHQDICRLPMGYRTLVGDMGSALSGGQKQRLILARALYRSPAVLFLDEATSHLDLETELRIHQRLRQLRITRILIAHRPETLRIADRVVSLDQQQQPTESGLLPSLPANQAASA